MAHNDHILLPGATYRYKGLASNLEPTGSSEKPLNLTILCVVFEDGSGDGDRPSVKAIQDRRHGEKMALREILPLLAQTNLQGFPAEATARLKERISQACENLGRSQSGDIWAGIFHGKNYVLTDLKHMDESRGRVSQVRLSEEFLEIQHRYDRKLKRLEGIVK